MDDKLRHERDGSIAARRARILHRLPTHTKRYSTSSPLVSGKSVSLEPQVHPILLHRPEEGRNVIKSSRPPTLPRYSYQSASLSPEKKKPFLLSNKKRSPPQPSPELGGGYGSVSTTQRQPLLPHQVALSGADFGPTVSQQETAKKDHVVQMKRLRTQIRRLPLPLPPVRQNQVPIVQTQLLKHSVDMSAILQQTQELRELLANHTKDGYRRVKSRKTRGEAYGLSNSTILHRESDREKKVPEASLCPPLNIVAISAATNSGRKEGDGSEKKKDFVAKKVWRRGTDLSFQQQVKEAEKMYRPEAALRQLPPFIRHKMLLNPRKQMRAGHNNGSALNKYEDEFVVLSRAEDANEEGLEEEHSPVNLLPNCKFKVCVQRKSGNSSIQVWDSGSDEAAEQLAPAFGNEESFY